MIYMITALLICVAMMAVLVGTLQAGLGSFANPFAGERYRGWKLAGLSGGASGRGSCGELLPDEPLQKVLGRWGHLEHTSKGRQQSPTVSSEWWRP